MSSEYIPIQEVMTITGLTQHQAARRAKDVRTRKDGRRTLYHRGDVETLAAARREDDAPPAEQSLTLQQPSPLPALIQGTDLVGLIERQSEQIATLSREVGQLQARAEQAEAERERLRGELGKSTAVAKLTRPFYLILGRLVS